MDEPTAGIDLRLARVRARVKLVSVARHAGVSRQRLQAIEASERPTRSSVERYLAALIAASRER